MSFVFSQLPGFNENPIYLRLSIVFIVILVVNGLWSFFSIVGVDLQRTTRSTRKQVGEVLTESFEVINRSIIPKAWLKVSDEANIPGGSGSRVVTWVNGRQSHTYVAFSVLQKRGWFKLGPTIIETGDLFGLFLLKKRFETNSRLLVIPYLIDIAKFPAPFGVLPGGWALREKTLEVTPYAAGVREFVQGDPLKRIHWPSSARKQKLIVKEFEKDPLAEVWIILDSQKSVHVSRDDDPENRLEENWWMRQKQDFKLPPDSEEYGITIAASISKYYLEQKRELGLVSVGQSYMVLPAERGQRQLGKILETLAVLKAEGNIPIWGVVGSQLRHLARGSTVIIITPSTNGKILSAMMELIQKGLMPVVILLDQASFGGNNDSADFERRILGQGISVIRVKEGDDLHAVLETTHTLFKARLVD